MRSRIIILSLALLALTLGASVIWNNKANSNNQNPLSRIDPLTNSDSSSSSSTSSQDLKEQEKCIENGSNDFDCYENYYTNLVKEGGIAAAFTDLKKRYSSNNFYVQAQCHPLTHVIGRTAAEGLTNPGEAFPEGDAFCWSGYYHGVLEGVIGKIGLKNLPREINNICSTIPGKENYSFDYYNCVHGLGHGVMAITQDELFKSLEYCDKLDRLWEQKSCASGVFMENVIIDQKNHFTKYLRPGEPLYPCTAVPYKYKDTCYLMQTSYILKINGGNFAQTFAECRRAEQEFQYTCFASLGRDASGRSLSKIEPTKNICLLGNPGDEQKYCVIGAVKDFISYYHSDQQAKQFCNSFSGNLKETCLRTAESYYRIF